MFNEGGNGAVPALPSGRLQEDYCGLFRGESRMWTCLFVGVNACGTGADPDPAGHGGPLGDLPPRDQEGGLSFLTRLGSVIVMCVLSKIHSLLD